eukprot:14737903-Alexandrium_andersonii.AAC.1
MDGGGEKNKSERLKDMTEMLVALGMTDISEMINKRIKAEPKTEATSLRKKYGLIDQHVNACTEK